MRYVLSFDEVIGGATVKAGTAVPATLANIDALKALALTFRAFEVADATTPLNANVQFAVLDQRARRPFRGVSLSNGVITAGAASNTPLAQIVTNSDAAISLTSDAGGKIALVGRYLVATAAPVSPGETLSISILVGTDARTFTLAGSGAPVASITALLSAIDGLPLTSAIDGASLRSAL